MDTANITESANVSSLRAVWQPICHVDDLIFGMGVVARAYGTQIAIFRTAEGIFALDNLDPFSHAAILSRGIVGDLKGRLVVASPMYKQHFCLRTGLCVEDESASVRSWPLHQDDDRLIYAAPPQSMEANDHELA